MQEGLFVRRSLSELLRPTTFEEFVGQEHLVGEEGALRTCLAGGQLPSMVLWGPPGTGKSTLARLLVGASGLPAVFLSASEHQLIHVREALKRGRDGVPVVVFLDEIHRFNRAQQDALLKPVESGQMVLIGATTENPSFVLQAPLLSRVRVFVLEPLSAKHLQIIGQRALRKIEKLYGVRLTVEDWHPLVSMCGGDARRLLNTLEAVLGVALAEGRKELTVTDALLKRCLSTPVPLYSAHGDVKYDIVSAFIKAVRGSDPHAALYWLARLTTAGEDPLYIARRLLILASEDVGLADPQALVVAAACYQAVAVLGYPECRWALAQTTLYLALAPKSNSAYLSMQRAEELARSTSGKPVPLHLRNAVTPLMGSLGYGEGYRYPHHYPEHYVFQDYMPEGLGKTEIYIPSEQEAEAQLWHRWRERLTRAMQKNLAQQ